MKDKNTGHRSLTAKMVLFGIGLGVFYWVLSSTLHALVLHHGTLTEQLFYPDSHHIWERSVAALLLVVLVVYTQFAITKHKRMGKVLSKSEAKFRSLAEQSPSMIFINKKGRVVYANKKCEEIMGYKREAFYSPDFDFLTLIAPESRDPVKANFSRHMKGEEAPPLEYTLLTKDGKRIDAILTTALIEYEGETAILGIMTDITERKRMEETVRDSEEKYRSLVNNVRLGIFRSTIGPPGKFLEVNPALEEITGYSREELLHMNPSELYVHPEERQAALEKVASAPGVVTNELKFRKKDGAEITVFSTMVAIKDSLGKLLYFDGITEDITERKQMEQELMEKTKELETASQAKSEFLAHMSHELRTPLNIISGFSQLMVDEVPGEINQEQSHCLSDILASSEQLVSLIDGALDLSKIESGKMELKLKNVALTKVIEPLTRTMTPILTPKKQRLDIEIEEGLPPVLADKTKIRQVFLNLLSNSAKFTPDGGKLKIEAVKDGDWCQVSVIDNGIGINKEDLERIFEPFYQLDNPLTKERNGTGLGLTLVKQIVERHGGRIWVESEYRKGSKFTFTLPLATSD